MINTNEILDTIHMIDQQHLDVRTITMGISLLDCADPDPKAACQKIYDKITRRAEHLVATGEAIEREFGIPIVNKRISVTPMALVAGASETGSYVPFAVAMDNAAKSTGVNFIGGFSALVQKGATQADKKLIASIPEALAITDFVCSSVNVGSTRAGINMAASSRTPPSAPPTGAALAAPSWWYSAMRWRITPSWRAPSTAWGSRTASSMWACPAPAWCTTPSRT